MRKKEFTAADIEKVIGRYLQKHPGARLGQVQQHVARCDPVACSGHPKAALIRNGIRRSMIARKVLEKRHHNRGTKFQHAWFYGKRIMQDTEWLEAISYLLGRYHSEVGLVIHNGADTATKLSDNEIVFEEKGTKQLFRVLVEPVPRDVVFKEVEPEKTEPEKTEEPVKSKTKYSGFLDPENLADDELMPEIVNIWAHGEKGSEETGEGLHGWMNDQGHFEQIERIIDEYRMRNKLPCGRWTKVADYRPSGHAYFTDRLGRVAVADNSGTLPHQCDGGVLYLDLKRALAATRFVVPLTQAHSQHGNEHMIVSEQAEVEFVRELWEKASRGEV